MPKQRRRPNPGPWNRKGRELGGSNLAFEGSGQSDLAVWRDGIGLALIPALIGLWPLLTGHLRSGRGVEDLFSMVQPPAQWRSH